MDAQPPSVPRPPSSFVRAQRDKARRAAEPPPRGGKGSIGVALMGGGNHAMVSAFGLMRGFESRRLANGKSPISVLDVLSSNSGGGWFNWPFMFAGFDAASSAEAQHTPATTLLNISPAADGAPTARPYPYEVTRDDVFILPATCLGYSLSLNPTCANAWSWMALSALPGLLPDHHLWYRYVVATYFKPFHVPTGKYLAASSAAAEAAIAATGDSSLTLDDFIWPRPGPMPKAVFTMMAPTDQYSRFQKGILGGGQYLWDNNLSGKAGFIAPGPGGSIFEPILEARNVGGGGISCVPYTASTVSAGPKYEWAVTQPYIMGGDPNGCLSSQPLAFPMQNVAPHDFASDAKCALLTTTAERLSPEAVAVASSSAYEGGDGALSRTCFGRGFTNYLRSVAVTFNASTTPLAPDGAISSSRLMSFGDGVTVDNTSIISQLQEEVEHIIFPVLPYQPYAEVYAATQALPEEQRLGYWMKTTFSSLYNLFGYVAHAPAIAMWASSMLAVVFGEGEARMLELMGAMDKLFLADKPMVYTLKDLNVLPSPFRGLTAYTCSLTVMVYNLSPSFGRQVGAVPGNGVEYDENTGLFAEPFEAVPNLAMAGQNTKGQCCKMNQNGCLSWNIDGYTNGQINLTSYLGTWTVNQAWEPVVVGGVTLFDGFGEIFAEKGA